MSSWNIQCCICTDSVLNTHTIFMTDEGWLWISDYYVLYIHQYRKHKLVFPHTPFSLLWQNNNETLIRAIYLPTNPNDMNWAPFPHPFPQGLSTTFLAPWLKKRFLTLHISTLKMEAACFSEMLVCTYWTIRYHNPEGHNIDKKIYICFTNIMSTGEWKKRVLYSYV
jgi:hypothetical protein